MERPQEAVPAPSELEAAVVRKVARRILPFVVVCYIFAYLDRSNLGFAALTMMPALGLNAAQYGFAAGIFFLGYIAFELPSNLMLVRFGPRKWIARIMITWGVIAVATAFVTGATSLYVMRLLLGIAEAGFFPGVIFYLAFWFPASYRAQMFGWFLAAIPISVVIGAPLSAALLYMDGLAGLQGWQWLFIVEGAPSILLGIACLYYLTDTPRDAHWLTETEKATLAGALERERGPAEPNPRHGAIMASLANPRMWEMSIIDLGLIAGSYGIVFFLPQIVAEFGFSKMQTGLITAAPFLLALVAMIAWGRRSDRTGERRWHMTLPLLFAIAGFVVAALVQHPVAKMLAFVVAAAGTYMSYGPFWQFVPTFLNRGKTAAASLAIINTIGSIAGFLAPFLMGYFKQTTGSYRDGLFCIAAAIGAAVLVGFRLSGRAGAARPG